MPKRLPIQAAKDLAVKYGLRQVILVAQNVDDETVHVVTYGKTKEDCRLAAEAGNNLKRHMGWPDEQCHSVPARLRTEQELIAP